MKLPELKKKFTKKYVIRIIAVCWLSEWLEQAFPRQTYLQQRPHRRALRVQRVPKKTAKIRYKRFRC